MFCSWNTNNYGVQLKVVITGYIVGEQQLCSVHGIIIIIFLIAMHSNVLCSSKLMGMNIHGHAACTVLASLETWTKNKRASAFSSITFTILIRNILLNLNWNSMFAGREVNEL